MAKRDYFDVLIVCPRESELQAALDVFQHETGSTFEGAHIDLPYNIRLSRGWHGLPLTIAMVAQVECGGVETMKLVSNLAKYFSVGLIAMTGICSGEEDRNRGIEYGTVVVAKRTTTECEGLKRADETVQSRACYKELNGELLPSLNELVQERESRKWSSYIPTKLYRSSPRYVKELLLECVVDNEQVKEKKVFSRKKGSCVCFKKQKICAGIEKRKLLAVVQPKVSGLTEFPINETLEKMQKEREPLVYTEGCLQEYKATHAGELYAKVQVEFPCKDKSPNVVAASIASVLMDTEKLNTEMIELKQHMADHDIKAIDREAHFFMEQATNNFSPGLPVVMKGISDYGTEASKLIYYEPYAASTSAAFLRHFITDKKSIISNLCVESYRSNFVRM